MIDLYTAQNFTNVVFGATVMSYIFLTLTRRSPPKAKIGTGVEFFSRFTQGKQYAESFLQFECKDSPMSQGQLSQQCRK